MSGPAPAAAAGPGGDPSAGDAGGGAPGARRGPAPGEPAPPPPPPPCRSSRPGSKGDAFGVFVSEYEKKNPLVKPKALREDDKRFRDRQQRSTIVRPPPEPTLDEEFANVNLKVRLDTWERHLRGLENQERGADRVPDRRDDKALQAAGDFDKPSASGRKQFLPKGGALQRWQDERDRRNTSITREINALTAKGGDK